MDGLCHHFGIVFVRQCRVGLTASSRVPIFTENDLRARARSFYNARQANEPNVALNAMLVTDIDSHAVTQAVAALRAGELVAIPTETVYGLAADASNPRAVAKVYALKGRPSTRPLIVHIAGVDQLSRWVTDVPAYARRWAEVFWPGPLTLVLPKHPDVPSAVTGGQDTIAIRVPDHPVTLALLRAFDGGLAAPSANRYGHISPTRAEHVRAEFAQDTPIILEGGGCKVGIESTIVSCLDDQPTILRPGAISAAMLSQAAGLAVGSNAQNTDIVVPGQVASHYAPDTPTGLLPHGRSDVWQLSGDSDRAGFLGFHQPNATLKQSVILPLDATETARQLYAALRTLDEAGLDKIWIEAPPSDSAWTAVWDRLRRAVA